MRRPKKPQDKKSPDDHQPPGGRAWQRVQDFARSRGLPTQSTPQGEEGQAKPIVKPRAPKKKRNT